MERRPGAPHVLRGILTLARRYINKRGVGLCALSGVLFLGGGYYALGPSYLHNPVVTATVTACRGSGPARYCVGSWPDGHGGTDHGGIYGLPHGGLPHERVKVKATGDSSATTTLELSAGGWFFRELLAAIPVAVAVALAIFLYKRRRRFITENPDQLPELTPKQPSS